MIAAGTPNNCSTAVTSRGGNAEDANTCGLGQASDKTNINPRLGPLQNNSGQPGAVTLTHMPLPGSPLVNAGLLAGCPAVDQLGKPRPIGAACDIGAVESWLWLFLPLVRR